MRSKTGEGKLDTTNASFYSRNVPPEICPVCGADVPRKARACPECGADDETGWSERAEAQRLGLPDDEFDYDEFTKEEFGGPKREVRPRGIKWLWWAVAVLLLIAIALMFSGGAF